jgi:hypothetical protein
MRFQFGTSTLLLATAFIAISMSGVAAVNRLLQPSLENMGVGELSTLAIGAPLWTPITFAAYALGKNRLTAKSVGLFAVTEAAAIGCFLWWLR